MSVSAISNTTPAVGEIAYQGVNPNAGKTALDADDFMKLLTAQLTAQDPMNPMKDTEFISQMANFSSLEMMKSMSASMSSFTNTQSLATAASFLGKNVTVKDTTSPTGEISGTVDAVVLNDGKPTVLVGGQHYESSLITKIDDKTATATATTN